MVKKIGNALLFLMVLGVFCFSLYKILTITRVLRVDIFGQRQVYSCDEDCPEEYDCGLCGLFGNLCGDFGDWCDQFCGCLTPTQGEPTPTQGEPTPTVQPTATPECPTSTPGEPTLTPVPEEPTPTPEEPTITPLPTSTPTPEPPGEPPVGGPPSNEVGEASVCGTEKPGTPTLISVTKAGAGQADLVWTAAERATHYSLVYGPDSGNYLYGVANTGRVTSYRVSGLDPNSDYCFAVRAVNDCQPGDLSNEICTGAVGGGQVLGATTLGDTGGIDWARVALLFYGLGISCLGFSRVFRRSGCLYVK